MRINKIKNFSYNLCLFFSGMLFSLIVTELVLRFYNPFNFRVKGDKITLPINKKYVTKNKKYSKLDKNIIHTKNSLGFRGEEPPEDFNKYLTIITIGGSTTECQFLSDNKTWPHILGIKLKDNFGKLWINNAGLDGHSTFGHQVLMEDYIAKLRPKFVLFLVGVNDIGRKNYGEFDKANIKEGLYFGSIKGFLKSMANYSEFFSIGLNTYRYFRAKSIGVVHKEIDLKRCRLKEIPKSIRNQVKQEHIENFLEDYEIRLRKLNNISKKTGIIPVFVTQPALYGNSIDKTTNINLAKIRVTDNLNGELAWEILELYNQVVRKIGYYEQIATIDLAKELPKDSSYYYDYLHFTNKGAERAAEIIYKYLKKIVEKNFSEFQYKNVSTIRMKTTKATEPNNKISSQMVSKSSGYSYINTKE